MKNQGTPPAKGQTNPAPPPPAKLAKGHTNPAPPLAAKPAKGQTNPAPPPPAHKAEGVQTQRMGIRERYARAIEYFLANRPTAETELTYTDPYQLAVAVILSAQCTDKRVNMITPALFGRFPTAASLAVARQEEVFELIRSCSYPNNKAKNIIGMAKSLVGDFKGIMPSDVDELQKLPGIGRKSANVLAAVIYNKPAMAVDTHVHRVSARIGLTENAKNPYQTEMQLIKHIPEHLIPLAHHWLILHGRYVCVARKPKCGECGLTGICKYYNTNLEK